MKPIEEEEMEVAYNINDHLVRSNDDMSSSKTLKQAKSSEIKKKKKKKRTNTTTTTTSTLIRLRESIDNDNNVVNHNLKVMNKPKSSMEMREKFLQMKSTPSPNKRDKSHLLLINDNEAEIESFGLDIEQKYNLNLDTSSMRILNNFKPTTTTTRTRTTLIEAIEISPKCDSKAVSFKGKDGRIIQDKEYQYHHHHYEYGQRGTFKKYIRKNDNEKSVFCYMILLFIISLILYQSISGLMLSSKDNVNYSKTFYFILKAEALDFRFDSGKKIPCELSQQIDLSNHFPNQPELSACIQCQCIEGYIECKRTAPVCPTRQIMPTQIQNSQEATIQIQATSHINVHDIKQHQPNRKIHHPTRPDRKRVPTGNVQYETNGVIHRPSSRLTANRMATMDGIGHKSNSQRDRANHRLSQGQSTTGGSVTTTSIHRNLEHNQMLAKLNKPVDSNILRSSPIDGPTSAIETKHEPESMEKRTSEKKHQGGSPLIGPHKYGRVTFDMLHSSDSQEFKDQSELGRRLGLTTLSADDPRHHQIAREVFGSNWLIERRRKERILHDRTSTTRLPPPGEDQSESDYDEEEEEEEKHVDEPIPNVEDELLHSSTTITTTEQPTSTTTIMTTTPATLEIDDNKETSTSDIVKPSISNFEPSLNNNSTGVVSSPPIVTDSPIINPFNDLANNSIDSSNQTMEKSDHIDLEAAKEMEKVANEAVFFIALGIELSVITAIILLAALFRYFDYVATSKRDKTSSAKGCDTDSNHHTRVSSSCSLVAPSTASTNMSDIKSNSSFDESSNSGWMKIAPGSALMV